MFFFFFFKQKTAYEMLRSLVGSEMCIRDRSTGEDQRDFVFLGLEQAAQSISTSTPATNQVAFSGPVRKYKDGRFVERHLVLKDGLLDLRRDPDRQSQEPKNIGEIEEVMMVPISEGSNVIENVFAITFAGERCHWFQSEQCKQWTEKIRLAMTVAAQWK
eukprot:TRINITY_DN1544_c0_g1_i1.p1 TRINITY_DN1544_c0_g1~~TRINITY_DN1544_c0_g1_i1.p1  ORF type:complete len:160 (+),score=65.87 TRINITY_DN1544_c0_g1_i1:118-597(+)